MPVPGANEEMDVIGLKGSARASRAIDWHSAPREESRIISQEACLRRGAKPGCRCAPHEREDALQLQPKHCVNSFSRHNVGAMHPRTVGRPPSVRQLLPVRRFTEWSRRNTSGIDQQPARTRERARTSKRPTRPSREAFTLIELLVVIAIIAILVGLLFPAFKAVQNQARQTQAKNDLTQIVNAVNVYYTDYGKYPIA